MDIYNYIDNDGLEVRRLNCICYVIKDCLFKIVLFFVLILRKRLCDLSEGEILVKRIKRDLSVSKYFY